VSSAPTAQLHYAPPLPLAQQQRVQRLIVWLALAAVVIIAGFVALPFLRYLRVLQLQARCLDYQPASSSPVFDTRPAALPSLQRSDRNYSNGSINGVPYVGYVPPAWRNFVSTATSGSRAVAIPFLHRLRAPSGIERLVAVELVPLATAPSGTLFSARVIAPGISGEPPRELAGTTTSMNCAVWPPFEELTIYPGTVDPANPDHFTIHVVSNGSSDLLDGWLRDDNTVVLERRATSFAQSNR
jgi:hypothetical protein